MINKMVPPRARLAAVLLVVVVLGAAACTGRQPRPASPSAVPGGTPSVTSPPSPSTPPGSPEEQARSLYTAWTKGDRTAALALAEPAAVSSLFQRAWSASDSWTFGGCEGAAGSTYCTWRRPGEQLVIRVRNDIAGPPLRVLEARFQSA